MKSRTRQNMGAYWHLEAAKRLAHRIDSGASGPYEIDNYFEEFAITTIAPRQGWPEGEAVVLGNWNGGDDWRRAHALLGDRLEREGIHTMWCDQWTTCSDCARAIQTEPDCYGWQPAYWIGDGEILCPECWDEETILESLEGDSNKCLQVDIDPSEYGYELIEDGFESGLHPGQTDNPEEIARELRARGIEKFVFVLDSTGQFDARFSVWEKITS